MLLNMTENNYDLSLEFVKTNKNDVVNSSRHSRCLYAGDAVCVFCTKKRKKHTQFELKLFKSVFILFAAKDPKYDHLLAMDPLLKI